MPWPDWDRREYYSASSIKTFTGCEKQFEFEYHTDQQGAEKDTQYSDLGTAVHEAIEWALLEGRAGFKNRAMNHYHEMADKLDLPEDRVGEGRKCITVAAKWLKKNQDVEILAIEDEIPYILDEVNQKMAAKLDIVADGEIWDWKTGSSKGEDWIQAAVYAGAYASKYGEAPESVTFVYLKKGEFDEYNPDQEQYRKLLKKIKEIQRTEEAGEYPTRPGDNCYWCSFEYSCPAVDVSYEGVDWEAY